MSGRTPFDSYVMSKRCWGGGGMLGRRNTEETGNAGEECWGGGMLRNDSTPKFYGQTAASLAEDTLYMSI